MTLLTLTKPFGNLRGLQFCWNPHNNFGWMSDSLRYKFKFYYLAQKMVTDGIFVDSGKDKVVEDIVDKVKTWYIKQIHDKVTENGVASSTIQGWTEVMEKVDIQTICKNSKAFDLVDAETFD